VIQKKEIGESGKLEILTIPLCFIGDTGPVHIPGTFSGPEDGTDFRWADV
jgi:hypothetical protein